MYPKLKHKFLTGYLFNRKYCSYSTAFLFGWIRKQKRKKWRKIWIALWPSPAFHLTTRNYSRWNTVFLLCCRNEQKRETVWHFPAASFHICVWRHLSYGPPPRKKKKKHSQWCGISNGFTFSFVNCFTFVLI